MAICMYCVPDSVRKYSSKQPSPVPCKECGEKPAFWWGPSSGRIDFK